MKKYLVLLFVSFLGIHVQLLAQPISSYNLSALNVSITSCCDSTTSPFKLYNTGSDTLFYDVPSCYYDPPLDSVLNRFNANFATINSLIPGRYDFIDGITGTSISDGGGDMYDGGNQLSTNLGGDLPYSDDTIVANAWLGAAGQYFTRKQQGLFVFAADLDNIDWFEINGDNGADGSGSADGTILTTQTCGKTFTGFVKRISGAGDPSINHLIIVESNSSLSHNFVFDTNDDQHQVQGLNVAPSTRIYYLLYAAAGGAYIDDTQTLAIMDAFLQTVILGTRWRMIPQLGFVIPGDSATIDATFFSCGLPVSSYVDDIIIYSNSASSPDTISASMAVSGVPLISLSTPCLDLDTIGVGGTNTAIVTIINSGCDTLFVSSMTSGILEFYPDTNVQIILPFDTEEITVSFSPTSTGAFADSLRIINDDVYQSVCLTGFALPAPTIGFSPDTISVTFNTCDDSTGVNFTVYNTGAANLNFSHIESTSGPFLNYAYTTNNSDNSVSVIDINTNTVVAGPISVGTQPSRVSIRPGGQFVYVSNGQWGGSNDVSVIRTSDNVVVATIPVGSAPHGLDFTPGGDFAYLANRTSNTISKINCNTNTVVGTITLAVGDEPQDVDITPDGAFAYVCTKFGGVYVIDLSTDLILTNIGGVGAGHSCTLTPNGEYLYVAQSNGGAGVVVISTATNTIITTVGGNSNPHDVAASPDGQFIYVADFNAGQMDVIDVNTNTVVVQVSDPLLQGGWPGPWGITVSPDGNYAYVGVAWSTPGVVVIDLNTYTVVTSMSLPGGNVMGIATMQGGLPWLTVTPAGGGTIVPGDSLVMTASIDADGINGGVYTGNVIFTSNDPNSPTSFPVVLTINGVPIIDLSANCRDLDTVMVGGTNTRDVWVYNTGCDSLFITGATTTLPIFTLLAPVAIAAKDSAILTISFSPTATGVFLDTVLLTTNDKDTSICLVGVGVPAPTISTDPTSYNVTLTSCDDTALIPLTIYNTGAADLDFGVYTNTNSPQFPYAYITNYGNNNVSIFDVTTNTLLANPVTVGTSAWRASLRPDNRYVYVSNRNSSNISVIQTSDNTLAFTIPVGFRPTGIGFTPDSRYAYVGNRDNNNVMKIDLITHTVVSTLTDPSLNNPQDVAMTLDGKYMYVANRNTGMTIYEVGVDTVFTTIPTSNLDEHSITMSPDGQFAYVSRSPTDDVIVISTATHTQVASIGVFDRAHEMDFTEDGTLMYVANRRGDNVLVVDAATNTIINTIFGINDPWGLKIVDGYCYVTSRNGGPDFFIIEIATNTIISSFDLPGNNHFGIAASKNGMPWLSAIPNTGATVPPGDSAIINIEFNGYGLDVGTFTGEVILSSNDPGNPFDTVQVTFTVQGNPQVDLSASCLSLDTILEFNTTQSSFWIYNTGCDTLTVTDENNNLSEFTLSDTAFVILPRDSALMTVTFSPLSAGTYLDTITIVNNDVDTTICLAAEALNSPTIATNPDTMNVVHLVCDDTSSINLTVYNTGAGDLDYTISTPTYSPLLTEGYVCDYGNATVSVIDLLTNSVTGSPIPVGVNPWRISIRPGNQHVYVSNRSSASVSVIQTSDNTVIATIAVGSTPTGMAMTPDGNFGYVGNRGSASVSKIDLNTNTVVGTLTQDINEPQDIVMTANGQYMYIANRQIGVTIYEVGPDTVIATLPSSNLRENSLAISPDGQYVYVSRSPTDDMLVISTATNTVLTTITGFNQAHEMAFTADGSLLYVANRRGNNVLVVDVATNTIVNTISGINQAWGMAIYGNNAYVTSRSGTPGLFVIDLSTNTITSSLSPNGNNHFGIAVSATGDPWLTASPNTGGTVLPGDSTIINIAFNGVGLNVGTYTANVLLASNDPFNTLDSVPVTFEVQGNPVIDVSASCLDLDTIMEFTSAVDTLTIYNTGCDTLFITDANNVLAEYTSSDTSGFILPGDSTDIYITFSPVDSGLYLDTITIVNNDVDTAICLVGYVLQSPTVVAIPDSLNVTIASCCDSLADSLMIYNTGAADLIFTIEGSGGGVLPDVLLVSADNLSYELDVQTKLVATGLFNSVTLFDAAVGTPTLGTLQSYDAVFVWRNNGFSDPTLLGDNLADYVDGGGGVVTAVFSNTSSTILGRWNTGDYWSIPPVGNVTGAVSLGTVFIPSHPIMENVVSFNGGTSAWRASNFSVHASATRVADWSDGRALIATRQINGSFVVDLGMFPPSTDAIGGGWVASTDGALIMANSLVYSVDGGSASWLTLTPLADTVAPGDSIQIDLMFNSCGLAEDVYFSNLVINSNDPQTPVDTVSLTFTVDGAPDIDILPNSCLDLDTAMEFTTNVDSFLIRNIGCDTLFITDGNNLLPEFTLSDTAGFIVPGDSGYIIVTFAPLDSGTYLDTITILNNDVDTTLCLVGIGLKSPTISESTDSIEANFVACCDSLTVPVTVYNSGAADLIFTASISGYDSTQTVIFTSSGALTNFTFDNLPPTDTVVVTVTLNGDYDGGGEMCELYIDGDYLGIIPDGNPSNGTNIVVPYVFTGAQLATWLADGQMIVTLDNDGSVGTFVGTEIHQVQVFISTPSWVSVPAVADTVAAGDSTTIDVILTSCGSSTGTFTDYIFISSNDPQNGLDTVVATMTLVGSPDIDITPGGCVDLDTIMEFTTAVDSFEITNTGCDTLFITDGNNLLPEFTLSDTAGILLPGESGWITVTFSPMTSGSYVDTITILNNDVDTIVCLVGEALQSPTISFNPDTVDVTIASCCDSSTVPVTVYNTGAADLIYSSILGGYDSTITVIWSGSGTASNLIFTGLPPAADTLYVTVTINGDYDSGTESCDLIMDGSFIQLMPDGNPVNGTNIVLNYTFTGAQLAAWLLDGQITVTLDNSVQVDDFVGTNIHRARLSIPAPGWITIPVGSDTIAPGDSAIMNIAFNSCGLSTNIYTDDIYISSNDPQQPVDTITVSFEVIGQPDLDLSDTCLYLDSIMEYTTFQNTVWIENTGCDTLFVTDANNLLPEYTLSDTTFTILPGDSSLLTVTFSPTASGAFIDTITLLNNDSDTTICLTGFGFPRPIMTVDTDSIDVVIIGCCDSTTVPVTIYNTGGNDLIWTIDTSDYVSRYDGVNDYITVPTSYPGLSVVTVEAWIRPTNLTGNHWIAGNARDCCGNAGGFNLYLDGNNLRGNVWRSVSATTIGGVASGVISLNTWQHVAMVYTGTQIDLYLNGALVGSGTPQGASGILDAPQNFVIGVLAFSAPSFYDYVGDIDEVRVWNTARTSGEIAGNRNSKLLGSESGLLGYWNFDGQNADDLTGSGNNGTFINQAATVIGSPFGTPVYTVNMITDTVAPGDSSVVDVILTTCGKTVGIYNSNIDIVSNDPLNSPYTIPTTFEVIGSPEIELSDTCVYLDSIMEFTTFVDSFVIRNVGCDTLFVTDANHLLPEYTLSDTAFVILPGDSATITITFAPVTSGTFLDTITVFNNDVDSTICLTAYAFPRPIMTSTPDSIEVTIASCCDSVVIPVTVYNTGGTDLIVGNDVQFGTSFIYSESFTGGSTYCSGSSQYDNWGIFRSQLDTNIYDFASVTIRGSNDPVGRTCTDPAVVQQIAGSLRDRATGDWVGCDGNTWHVGTGCVTGCGSASDEVEINADGGNCGCASGYMLRPCIGNSNWGGINTTACGAGSQTMIVEFTFNSWLEISPTVSDTIAPGDSGIFDLEFNSCGQFTGVYNETVILSSNDPLNPADTIPLTFTVQGFPIIDLSDSCLNFDTLLQYTSTTRPLTLYNNGCDTLFVTNILSSSADITVDTTAFILMPGDSLVVTATFSPLSVGAYAETLTIFNNDADSIICLTGFALSPPIIAYVPDTFFLTGTVCNDTLLDTLTIYNNGVTDLTFSLASVSFTQFSPTVDTVVFGDSSLVGLEFNTNGLITGTYYDTIYISSNDPLSSMDTVLVILDVIGYPVVASSDTCLNFDSILQFTNTSRQFQLYNTGCDTLWVDSIEASLSAYSIDSGAFFLPPGDSILLTATFAPTTLGAHSDTFNVYSNDSTLAICLIGVAVPPPVISTAPDTINLTITACTDSVTTPLTVYNTGGSTLNWTIDTGGYYVKFDGAGDYISMGNSSVRGQSVMTIEMWAQPKGSAINFLIENGASLSDPSIENVGGMNPLWYVANSGGASFGILAPGAWAHLAATIDGTRMKTYLNGSLVSDIPFTLSSSATVGTLFLGSRSGGSFFFDGWMDEVRVWNVARTQAEIQGNMSNTLVGNETGLTGYWNFNDGTATDLSSGGNDGTFFGNATVVADTNVGNLFNLDLVIDTVFVGDSSVIDVTFDVTSLSPGTYVDSIVISSNDPLVPELTIPTLLTISPFPTAPVAGDSTICFGDTNPTFIATGDAGSNGDTIYWFSDAALTVGVDTGNTFTPLDVAVGSYTYYLTYVLDSCSSPYDSIIFTINTGAAAPIASDTGSCFGDPVPDLTSTPGNIIIWYDDAGLTNQVFTGQTFTTGETASAVYTYYLVDSVAGCPASPSDTVLLTITGLPPAPIAGDTTICEGDSVPDLVAVGANIVWYDNPLPSVPISTNDSLATGETTGGVYVYYVTQDSVGCPSLPDTVTLTINSTTPPTTSDAAICFNAPGAALVAVGDSINWYSDSLLAVFQFQGDSFFAADVAVGSYTYWATETDSITGCESIGDSAVYTINPIPAAPVTSDTSECFGQAMPDLAAIGTAILWYQNPALDTVVGTGTPFSTGETVVGSHKYYVTQTVLGCEGPADSAILTILPIPAAPVTSDSTICFGMTTPDFIAVGANIHWYSDAGLTTLVFTGDTFVSGDTTVGTHIYYAADSVAGCEGPASMMTVTITAPPVVPVVADATICFGAATPDLIYVGSNTQWYDNAALTNVVASTDTFVTGNTSAAVYTYYVTDSTTACPVSASDTVVLTINAIPTAPVTSDTSICLGDSVPSLIAVGTGLDWYADTLLAPVLFSGDTFAAPDTLPGVYDYYVTQTIAGCIGPADTVVLSINSTPAPTGSNMGICFGDPVPDFIAVGTNLSWYSDSALTTLVFMGDTFTSGDTTVGTHTYYVRDSINGCSGPSIALTLTINLGNTAPPIASDVNSCYGATPGDLTAIGTFLTWYSDTGLTTIVFSGDSFAAADTAVGSYVYYVTDSVSGCPEGSPDTSTLTILALPASPVAVDDSTCFGINNGQLVASGAGIIQWYSDAALTNMVGMGDTLTPSDTAIGSYTYYATDSVGICESTPDTAVFTILPIPGTPSSADQTVCVGTPAPDFVSSGANIQWYADLGLTTLLMAGDTFVPADTLVGVHTYYLIDSAAGCNSLIVLVNFTIDGASQIAISDICFDFDSVIETTTSTDTLEFYNAGCDTLIITGITNATAEYSVDTTGLAILPGDTGIIIISFTPPDSGTYVDTLLITSNASDTSVCLTGVGLGAPVISNSPDSFNLSYTGCCESTTLPMTIYNTGESNLNYSIGSDSSWISFSLTNDTIAPGDSTIVNITFDGCTINPGNYTANIYLTSNDPVSPLDTSFVVLTKDTLPVPPLSADIAVCFGNTVGYFTATSPDDSIVWYNDSLLTIRLFEGDTFYPPDTTVVGVFNYYATAWRDSCEGSAAVVQLDISPPPTTPSVADTNECFGYAVPALVHAGTIVQWFDDTAMTNVVFVGDSFVSTDTAVGSYTYFLNDSTPGCPIGAPDTVVLTIDPTPVAPTGNDTTVCFGDPVPDLIAVGINLAWYDDSTLLSAPVFMGDTFVSGDTAVGIHRYWVTQTDTSVNNCESFPLEVVLTINGIPSAPIVGDQAICLGNPIPNFVAFGTNLVWYDDFALTNVIGTGNLLTPPDTVAGIFTYYVTDSVTACATGPPGTATFTINAFSPIPTVIDTSVCFGSANPILVASGTNLAWFDDSLLGNLVFTGDSFPVADVTVGTHTYYVTDSVTGCAPSVPDTSDFIIEAVPSAPITSDATICFGDLTPDLSATGVEVFWYSDSLLDSLEFAGNPFNNNDTVVGAHVYYVTQVDSNVNACASPSSMVTLTINALPAAPTVLSTSVCEGVTNPDFTAIGAGTILWYSDAALLINVGVGATLVVTDSVAGVYDYYATQTILGCEGPAVMAILTINPTPSAPVAVNDSVCAVNATGIPSLSATGTNLTWYSDTLLTNAVGTGNFYNTGMTAPGTYTYYVTDSLPGCVGPSTQVSLVINPMAAAPSGANQVACVGQTIPDLTATGTGTDLRWYSDPTLFIQVGAGGSFATGQTSAGIYTYYVTEYAQGCSAGPSDTVTLTINPTPLITLSDYTLVILPGDSVAVQAFNATNYTWSPATGLNTASGSTVMASPSTTTTYTVTGTNVFGCAANASVLIVVDDGTSIGDMDFVQNVQIFPNPSRGVFELIFTSTIQDPIEISIFNAVGEIIIREDADVVGGSYHKTFNLVQMATGVYYIQITSTKGVVNKKMIILQDY